jgi:hypothetical protein
MGQGQAESGVAIAVTTFKTLQERVIHNPPLIKIQQIDLNPDRKTGDFVARSIRL